MKKTFIKVMGLSLLAGSLFAPSAYASNQAYEDMKWEWPTTSTRITDPYGSTDGRWHKGIDIGVKQKSVYASANGKVVFAGKYSGKTEKDRIVAITIEHDDKDPDTGKKLITRYLHLEDKSMKVKTNDRVSKGDKIATSGNTGNVGYHLHFDVNDKGKKNPEDYETFNPMVFYPDVSMKLKSNFTALNDYTEEQQNCSLNDYPDEEYSFDQLLIDYVGEDKFEQWFNNTVESKRTMTEFKNYFGLTNEQLKNILGD